jgi:SAM-dependent methyltransferase
MGTEADKVIERYGRRTPVDQDERYSMLRPEVLLSSQERMRVIAKLLARNVSAPLFSLRVLEIGCGAGNNLLELIRLGFDPANVVANELQPQRVAQARHNLPAACQVLEGDATALPFAAESFDIVFQSTVFTSLLDDGFQKRLAERMWNWVKPGGAVLWYDFIYNNPRNPDVRGVSFASLRRLFPAAASFTVRRVTLAPPISRRVCRLHPLAYHCFNIVPWLRTHIVCWIEKKRPGP